MGILSSVSACVFVAIIQVSELYELTLPSQFSVSSFLSGLMSYTITYFATLILISIQIIANIILWINQYRQEHLSLTNRALNTKQYDEFLLDVAGNSAAFKVMKNKLQLLKSYIPSNDIAITKKIGEGAAGSNRIEGIMIENQT